MAQNTRKADDWHCRYQVLGMRWVTSPPQYVFNAFCLFK